MGHGPGWDMGGYKQFLCLLRAREWPQGTRCACQQQGLGG